MAKSRKVRWQCPTGEHPGKLGSTRPPMDATVRYCWPCSVRASRLVRRVAPALERERAARSAARASAPARAAESLVRRATVEVPDAHGRSRAVDLLAETASCCEMLGRGPLSVTVKRTTRAGYSESGRAWPGRVHYTVGPQSTYERLTEVVLHEVVHTLDESSVEKSRGRSSYHGPRFKRVLFDTARLRWPQIQMHVYDLSRWERTGKAYDLDDAIVEAMRTTCAPLTDIENFSITWESGS